MARSTDTIILFIRSYGKPGSKMVGKKTVGLRVELARRFEEIAARRSAGKTDRFRSRGFRCVGTKTKRTGDSRRRGIFRYHFIVRNDNNNYYKL